MAASGNLRTETETYSNALIRLHWITAAIMIALVAAVELHEFFEKGSAPRALLMTTHFSLGLSVLALVILRVFVRGKEEVPAILPTPHALVHLSAKVVHLALYAIMFAMPVIGYLLVNAKGRTVPFFGLQLPMMLAENKELAHTLEEAHELIGNIAIVLVIAHALAALLHHHYYKDNTLVRMMPARRSDVA